MPSSQQHRPQSTGMAGMWDNGSHLYRRLVLTGSGLFLVGIVLAVVGALTERLPLSWTALAILGAGVLCHLTAQTVRFRDAARNRAARDVARNGGARGSRR
ncbi:hypothetical protein ACSBQY_01690 [Micrococcus lylae]|uniref:hypothetical protein n=1 Tax=Micrococcus TaxID=1269 RepID=UPI00082FDFCA|nr:MULTISPECIES: hypothetical protein [Micrococcus]OFR91149.1 hypothetical protein HMPREF2863_05160 [Micrococcus sp. HMSC067E09]WIK81250.1 hypothetical protein CJ228_006385 [Micrococcus lylae]